MKLTCVSKGGGGYHSPASHVLEVCGHRLLLECPIDFSATSVFSPLPCSMPPSSDAAELIRAAPWYKLPGTLNLWDCSLFDAVLVSSPAAMLGLPFLTRHPNFSAKIYATEVSARIGRLLMEELVVMQEEFVRFYGPDEMPGFPDWMKWEELDKLQPGLRDIVIGLDGEELGNWMPLYSSADIKKCFQSIQPLKYAEEVCHDGTLCLNAFSSGMELGSCNWLIDGPRRNIAYLSCSIFKSSYAAEFDFHSLIGKDLILFSDFSFLNCNADDGSKIDDCPNQSQSDDRNNSLPVVDHDEERERNDSLVGIDENLEECEKLSCICSLIVQFLKDGRSVLLSIGRLGILAILMEQISKYLEDENIEVPMFMISTAAEEMLALTNVVPEWLCKERQEKLFCGESLFGHTDLIKKKKLQLFRKPSTPQLLLAWQEPCVVFSPHWTLRLGPIVPLLKRWHAHGKCLLILEKEVTELSFLPFKSFDIKVLQCSFLSGLKMQKLNMLLTKLKPKLVLFPEYARPLKSDSSFQMLYYKEHTTVRVPSLRTDFEALLSTDLVYQLQPKRIDNVAIARMQGQLLMRNTRYELFPVDEAARNSWNQPLVLWGTIDPTSLLQALEEKGLGGTISRSHYPSSDDSCSLHITTPEEAKIQIDAKRTVIFASNENMATIIYEALCKICNGI